MIMDINRNFGHLEELWSNAFCSPLKARVEPTKYKDGIWRTLQCSYPVTFLCCSVQSENDTLCRCGYIRSAHPPSLSSPGSSGLEDWKVDTHTRSTRTNAFGTVEFLGFGENERNVSNWHLHRLILGSLQYCIFRMIGCYFFLW
jgi:hypothetical protein